ncbi:MAG: hypothetical protein U0167_06790 [bacterium]
MTRPFDVSVEPLDRDVFDAAELVALHPPLLWNPNKRVVFQVACPRGSSARGRISYSQWPAMPLPESADLRRASQLVEARADVYDYAPAMTDPRAVEWHVNFADPHLFVAYGSGLFAQDEMQVAEHPALGSLKEALEARRCPVRTVAGGRPTPVLVMGVERRCRVDTAPNAAEGRPHGLYGNAFAAAAPEDVRRATARIDPPTVTNLIAMAAPAGGRGRYLAQTIERILITALTAFRAAVMESDRSRDGAGPVAVHTGFWGCGAFGGDRVLMALLQMIAAQMAEVDRLVFHAVSAAGVKTLETARARAAEALGGSTLPTAELIERIEALGFTWGVSDGN